MSGDSPPNDDNFNESDANSNSDFKPDLKPEFIKTDSKSIILSNSVLNIKLIYFSNY